MFGTIKHRRLIQSLVITFVAIILILLIAFGCTYVSRVHVWDQVTSCQGTIELNRTECWASWLTDRAAFGLGIASVNDLSAVDIVDGNSLLMSVRTFAQMNTLMIANSNLTDKAFTHTAHAPNLKTLSIWSNPVSEVGIQPMLQSSQLLETVHLGNTNISDSVVPSLMALPRLLVLTLQNTEISGAAFDGHAWAGSPYNINLEGCRLSSSPFRNVPGSLVELNISNNGDVSSTVAALGAMPLLRLLVIDNCSVRKVSPKWLLQLRALRILSVADVDLASELLWNAASLPHVSVLNVSQSTIDSSGWDAIAHFPSLQILECRETDMSSLESNNLPWTSRLDTINLIGARISIQQIEGLKKDSGARRIVVE